MSSLKEHFHTDWAAMTASDWMGLVATVTIFVLMIVLYAYVLHPKNKDSYESKGHIPFIDDEDDHSDTEDKK